MKITNSVFNAKIDKIFESYWKILKGYTSFFRFSNIIYVCTTVNIYM